MGSKPKPWTVPIYFQGQPFIHVHMSIYPDPSNHPQEPPEASPQVAEDDLPENFDWRNVNGRNLVPRRHARTGGVRRAARGGAVGEERPWYQLG